MTGEVLVTTAQDPELASTGVARPFFVQTELGRIRPMGTRFAVRWVDADSAQVAVFEGAVEIAPSHAASPPRTLNAGQQTRFTERSVDTIGPADEQSTAWTTMQEELKVSQEHMLDKWDWHQERWERGY